MSWQLWVVVVLAALVALLLIGRKLFGRLLVRKAKRLAKARKLNEEEARRQHEEMINQYPVMFLTQAEYDSIPRGAAVELDACPIGTWFRCTDNERIIGQVVKGEDAFQVGAALSSLHEREINRWRVMIVQDAPELRKSTKTPFTLPQP